MFTEAALATTLVVSLGSGLLLILHARPSLVGIFPLVAFLTIELIAVWPALFASADRIGIMPAAFACVGSALFVLFYLISAGPQTVHRPGLTISKPSPRTQRAILIGLGALTLILVAAGIHIFRGVPPLLTSWGTLLGAPDSGELIRETRRSITKDHLLGDGFRGQGIINQFYIRGWQVAAIFAFVCWSWARTRATLALLLIAWLLAFIFLGSLGARAHVLIAAAGVACFIVLSRRLTQRTFIFVGAGVILFSLLIAPLSKGSESAGSLSSRLQNVAERITEGNGQNNVAIIELRTRGSLVTSPGDLFVERTAAMVPGLEQGKPFAYRLTQLAYPDAGGQVTGYATPTQYGLIYADFGPLGLPLGYALAGVVLGAMWRRITSWRGVLVPTIAALAAVHMGYMNVTGIHGLVASLGVIAIIVSIVSLPTRAFWYNISGPPLGLHDQRRSLGSSDSSHHQTDQAERPEPEPAGES